MLRRKLVMISLLAAMFTLNACSATTESTSPPNKQHRMPNGDLQEKTSSFSVLPNFLNNQQVEIKQVYQLAAGNADLLQWMPCYCGCAVSAGHKSNQNCFIKEVERDQSVIWDDHGTRCGVCMEIAVKSVQLKQQGKSNLEIRNLIDEAYNKGFAKPTPTPMPT